ncbi:DUF397 domain-containing protein [Streptomyces prunicolor]|uniref:DUF397 domain-containing protein n=1 Tax=Streptomyces prunicolor TaxID=67348 RepID=UPI0037178AE5
MPKLSFTKSSYSTPANECLEVAHNIPGTVAIRDSKTPNGPLLRLTPTSWTKFTATLR